MSPTPNYYAALQVLPTADQAAIRASYDRLVNRWRSERKRGAPAFDDHINLLDEAYSVLSRPEERNAYDQRRAMEESSGTDSALEQQKSIAVRSEPVISLSRVAILWPGAALCFAVVFVLAYSRLTATPPRPEMTTPQPSQVEQPSQTLPETGIAANNPRPKQPEVIAAIATPAVEPRAQPKELTPTELFDRVSPSVVKVAALDRQGKESGFGTGFLVGTNGLIATNYHVIEKAHAVQIVLPDGAKLAASGVLAWDKDEDLAVIRVPYQFSATPLKLAGNELPRIGTHVYAIGNPRGQTNTLSDGLVSGHRNKDGTTWIQMTAAISPGSSGGPLLRADGRVVGVTTSVLTNSQSLNFAVPASRLSNLLAEADRVTKLARFPIAKPTASEFITEGNMWFDKEDYDQARAAYAEAIRLEPRNALAYTCRGNASLQSKNYDDAISDFTEALRLNRKQPIVLMVRGMAYHYKEQFDDAIRDYTEAIRLNPDDPLYYKLRGKARVCVRDYVNARKDFAEAHRLDPVKY